jgi:hypothetical protein
VCGQFDLNVSITSFCNLRELDKGSLWYSGTQAWKMGFPGCLYITSAPKIIYFMKGVDTIYIGISPGKDSSSGYDSKSWNGHSYFIHEIAIDDSLGSIAEEHKVNADDIMSLEGDKYWLWGAVLEGKVTDENKIKFGNEIRIPSYGVRIGNCDSKKTYK